MTKKDLSILIGNALDHFDTALYGFLAPLLAPLFFPDYEPVVQLILAYSLLATSLITRPAGAFIFGVIARLHGPALGLSYSLIGVAITTVSIGCLPTYATAAWGAPLGLILLRVLAGFFAAGEVTIAQLYLLEDKPQQEALKASYLYQTSTIFGIILASGAATLVMIFNHDSDILWRCCFWFGGTTGFIGYFLRQTATTAQNKPHSLLFSYSISSLGSLWHYRNQILRIAIATSFSQITYMLPFVFMNSFIPLITAISLETMMSLNTTLLIFDMIMIPMLGRLTLNYDPVKMMTTASLIVACTIIPLFQGLYGASLLYVTFVRLWIVLWGVVFLCPLNFWCKKLVNSPEQYLIVGMGNAIGGATLGRMTPAICLWLWHVTQWPLAPAIYIALITLATVIVVKTSLLKDTHEHLDHEEILEECRNVNG